MSRSVQEKGEWTSIRHCPPETDAKNWGFDVTPARLIEKLICERGLCDASEEAILELFPEKKQVEIDEGYVKFSLSMTDGDIPKHPDWEKLNEARGSLHQLGLIGTYPNGIGFGNASMRNSGLQFIITGTATGGIPILRETDYCLVQSFELEKNQVRATGRTKASSESMTHGAIYSVDESIRCVLHFHNRKIFDSMLLDGTVPKTKKEVEYGTPRMASAMDQIVRAGLKATVFLQRKDMTKAYSHTAHP